MDIVRRIPFRAIRHVATVALVVMFVVRALTLFLGAGHDDVYIFLWSGKTLMDHPWFANVNGELEDMVSSPLAGLVAWACVVIDPATSLATFKLAGLAAAAICIPLTRRLADLLLDPALDSRRGNAKYLWWGLGAAAIVALTPSFSYWAMGGMETSFQALLLLLIALATHALVLQPSHLRLLVLSGLCTLFVLVRLEGLWIPAVLTLTLVSVRREIPLVRTVSALAIFPLAVFIASCAARRYFTGAVWPNPVYAKGGTLTDLIPDGANYLWHFAWSSPLIFLLSLAPWIAAYLIREPLADASPSRSAQLALLRLLCVMAIVQDLFVLSCGGNWMTHYRFLVPTLPIKAVILCWLAGKFSFTPMRQNFLLAGMAAGLLVLPNQPGKNPNFNFLSQPTPVDFRHVEFGSLGALQQQMIIANQPHRRDESGVRPYIESDLASHVRAASRPLCLATYQVGYFPWLLRQRYGPDQVYLVDTFGLNNRSMALRPSSRNSLGLIDGTRIDQLIKRRDPQLLWACGSRMPDLIYMLSATNSQDRNLYAAGYRSVWSREGAVVYALSPSIK